MLGKECCDKYFKHLQEQPWKGIAPGIPLNQPISRLNELTSVMYQKVDDLCEDAANYVNWTLKWPQFVQIVRSIRQGSFMGDLGWKL